MPLATVLIRGSLETQFEKLIGLLTWSSLATNFLLVDVGVVVVVSLIEGNQIKKLKGDLRKYKYTWNSTIHNYPLVTLSLKSGTVLHHRDDGIEKLVQIILEDIEK